MACFNTQPPEGGWRNTRRISWIAKIVSTHSRPKAAGCIHSNIKAECAVSTHSRPKAAGWVRDGGGQGGRVSTHSRPKAAGEITKAMCKDYASFNTQPPEGGWTITAIITFYASSFNTQPPEGGWPQNYFYQHSIKVSTHSRPKAAGPPLSTKSAFHFMFQHTAARRRLDLASCLSVFVRCFNTQPPEGGWHASALLAKLNILFQHTAARRRLGRRSLWPGRCLCFNTQPPEGGWVNQY